MKSLLKLSEYEITPNIKLIIPTVGEILENESNHFYIIQTLISTPFDMIVQLDDIGIDCDSISEYELFLILFESLKGLDTSLIFSNLKFEDFENSVNTQNDEKVLYNKKENVIIDKLAYEKICNAIEKVYLMEKNKKTVGNADAKSMIIKQEKKKLKRRAKEEYKPYLENLIISLVNTEEFKYNYETTEHLSICKFLQSFKQINKVKNWKNIMQGYYFGNVELTSTQQEEVHWLS